MLSFVPGRRPRPKQKVATTHTQKSEGQKIEKMILCENKKTERTPATYKGAASLPTAIKETMSLQTSFTSRLAPFLCLSVLWRLFLHA